MEGIICIFLVGLFIFGFIASLIIIHHPGATRGSRRSHNPNHPGLMKHGKDVICPKCKSPYCQYYYEERLLTAPYVKSKTKVHPFNPFKPFVEDKYTYIPGQTYQLQRFYCMNCGYIFD